MDIQKLQQPPLSLSTDGRLTLFFVGVGSAFSKRHYQTNLLIAKGSDHVLVDCGTKAPQALYELGISVTDIDTYLITHSHADHIGGLEEVMLLNRYVARRRPKIIVSETYQHILWDMSLRGGAAFNEVQDDKYLTFGDMWKIVRPAWRANYPRETLEVNVGTINLKLFRTMHIPEQPATWQECLWSVGLIIDDRVMFTSDTRFDPELLESFGGLFDLEMIFHDAQFHEGGVHASTKELATLPAETKKKMILVHYGDAWEKQEKRVRRAGFHSLAKQWHYYRF